MSCDTSFQKDVSNQSDNATLRKVNMRLELTLQICHQRVDQMHLNVRDYDLALVT